MPLRGRQRTRSYNNKAGASASKSSATVSARTFAKRGHTTCSGRLRPLHNTESRRPPPHAPTAQVLGVWECYARTTSWSPTLCHRAECDHCALRFREFEREWFRGKALYLSLMFRSAVRALKVQHIVIASSIARVGSSGEGDITSSMRS
jgi:hypothetical protein